ncbi:hypothetical protein [Nocardia sp.]|uniref:hypothetical protein n=1 Tax=Nocardia sp. TaxID=1821 RepID=UPI003F9135F8
MTRFWVNRPVVRGCGAPTLWKGFELGQQWLDQNPQLVRRQPLGQIYHDQQFCGSIDYGTKFGARNDGLTVIATAR